MQLHMLQMAPSGGPPVMTSSGMPPPVMISPGMAPPVMTAQQPYPVSSYSHGMAYPAAVVTLLFLCS